MAMFGRARVGVRGDLEFGFDLLQKIFRRVVVEVFNHTVVRQNAQLVRREDHALEKVVFLVGGVCDILRAQRLAGAARALGAVVAVGDVERRNLAESFDQLLVHLHGRAPDGVYDFVRGDKIEKRLGGDDPPRQLLDHRVRAMGQKDGAGLRADREHVTRAVVLFVLARTLVFEDRVVVVLVYRAERDQAGLRAPRHYQSINIEPRFFLDDKRRPLDQPVEIGRGFGVDLIGVDVHAFGHFDLGPRDPQEAQRVAVGERAGFFGVDYVIWD